MSVNRSLVLFAVLAVASACGAKAGDEASSATDPTVDLQGGLPPLDTERPGGDDTEVPDTDVVDTDVATR